MEKSKYPSDYKPPHQEVRVVPYEDGKPLSGYDCCAIEKYPTDTGPVDDALRFTRLRNRGISDSLYCDIPIQLSI